MRKTVGIITFHGSFNYGSMLQAYALQQVVTRLGYECEIINFRTQKQKDFYRPSFLRGRWLGRIKRTILYFPYLFQLLAKQRCFQDFMMNNLKLSAKEYATLQELEYANLHYDYYISGSDQIWNTHCFDFDWAYFLPFVKSGKKIAYAPSMGPLPDVEVATSNEEQIKRLIASYDFISVREAGTANRIGEFIENEYQTVLDPTLLLDKELWMKMAGDKAFVNGDYILLYTPWYNEKTFSVAARLAEKMNLKVVVTQMYDGNVNHWLYKSDYKPYLATGPIEFLNLCKYATCIIGNSFHLAVFSVMLSKSFYIVNGMSDSRVSNLLRMTGLENRSVNEDESFTAINWDIDFVTAHRLLEAEKQRSLKWIKDCLK